MSETKPGLEPAQDLQTADAAATSDLASTSRRRVLLKGLGRAGAVAAAAVPLKSLAGASKSELRLAKNGKNYRCTVSAQLSMVHSTAPTGDNCRGNPVSYYCLKTTRPYSNWPQSGGVSVCYSGGTAYNTAALFKQVMGVGGSSYDGMDIGTILKDKPTSAEAHWITALLNATKCAATYPYSATDVRDLYVNEKRRSDALQFFSTYLEGASA